MKFHILMIICIVHKHCSTQLKRQKHR